MKFHCENPDSDHDEPLESIKVGGFTIDTIDNRLRDGDLDGVTFTINAPDDGSELDAGDIKSDSEGYLERFPYIYEALAEHLNEQDDVYMGYWCPLCGKDDGNGWVTLLQE